MSDVIWNKYAPKTPLKRAWMSSFKPKRQNLYIAISPELFIRRTSDLKTEFRQRNALRGWFAITRNQIQHGWLPPSWKSILRHNSAVHGPILTKFGIPMQIYTPITAKWSIPKPEVEFQYGGRLFFHTGSSYISALNWDYVDEIWFAGRLWPSEGSDINKYETGSSIERPRPTSWEMDMTSYFRFGQNSAAWSRMTCRLRGNGRDRNRK